MLGIPTGGSDNSLYNHLINLDRSLFEPIVIFTQGSFHSEKLKNLGIQILIKSVPKVKKNKIKKKESANSDTFSNKDKIGFINYLKIRFGREIKAIWKAIPEIIFVIKLIRQYKIDILHTNFNLSASRGAVIAGILSRIPIIVHNRGLSNLLKIDIFISRFVEKIICISDFVKREYTEKGIQEKKCIVISNGVDTDSFKPLKNKGNDKLLIVSIGRFEKWKGQEIFIKAAAVLLEKYGNLEFWLIGDGSERGNLESQIASFEISDEVKIIGPVSNTNEYLQKADIFVHTSIEPEPFGRVIIEAMACGLPVIATKIGGPLEIINDREDGVLIPPNDVVELIKVLEMLITQSTLRKKISLGARSKIKSKFSIKTTTTRIQEYYQVNNIHGIE